MAKTKPTPENKMVARHAASSFGGTPSVSEYLHDTEPFAVPILSCVDRPCDGVTSFSTVGLSDYPMIKENGSEFPVRLEIAGACASKDELFPNVIASVAFSIMRTKKLCFPGAVLEEYVGEYFQMTTVPHLYFSAPFLWEDSLKTLECGTKNVSWLMVIPISDNELKFLTLNGDDALESLFEKKQIDIFDLNRPSVL